MEGGLKYELCFLYYYKRHSYDQNVRAQNRKISVDELLKNRDQEIFGLVKRNFPYESDEVLKIIQERVLKNIRCGIHPGSTYKLIKERFKDQLESISSSNLYHFTKSSDYLLSALKSKSLHPTIANFDEYFPANKIYAILGDPEIYAPLNKLRDDLDKLKMDLLDQSTPKDRVIKKYNLPIFSCFTEMPESSLSFHAHHYGFWGISFNKERMLFKREWDSVNENHYSLCPVLYLASGDNHIEDILKKEVICGNDEAVGWRNLKELLKIKPILIDNLSHETIFSTYFEREWRYISDCSLFEFDYDDIDSIFVSRELWDYRNLLRRDPSGEEVDDVLSEIIRIVEQNDIKVKTIGNVLLHKSGTLL